MLMMMFKDDKVHKGNNNRALRAAPRCWGRRVGRYISTLTWCACNTTATAATTTTSNNGHNHENDDDNYNNLALGAATLFGDVAPVATF